MDSRRPKIVGLKIREIQDAIRQIRRSVRYGDHPSKILGDPFWEMNTSGITGTGAEKRKMQLIYGPDQPGDLRLGAEAVVWLLPGIWPKNHKRSV